MQLPQKLLLTRSLAQVCMTLCLCMLPAVSSMRSWLVLRGHPWAPHRFMHGLGGTQCGTMAQCLRYAASKLDAWIISALFCRAVCAASANLGDGMHNPDFGMMPVLFEPCIGPAASSDKPRSESAWQQNAFAASLRSRHWLDA